jgi:ABC-2 type transport system permease protein
MNTILVLLSPFFFSWRNEFTGGQHQRTRRCFLLILGVAFWFGVYYGVRRVLLYLHDVHELGPALAYQLLLIILLTFLSLLLFSNLINALSAFFLARDLDLVLSAPVNLRSFYYSRLITTTVHSSWMVLFFSMPVFAAYAAVFGGGALFYLWVLLVLPLFLLIPAAVGIFVTHLLVYFLPAKRIRDILFLTGLLAFVALYVLFRFSQPERLVNPESFGHFAQFLTAMESPSAPFLPSSWSAEILAATLFNRPAEKGFLYALLASYALFFPLAASWISSAVYLTGWSKAQEAPQGTRNSAWLERALEYATRPFPAIWRAIMLKDIRTFMRDTTQWSQVFLLTALIVVYLYNFKVLPLDRSPLPPGTLRTLVSFANLALAGFVLSAVAVRFAFPAVSLEGKAFWIVQTAPVSLRSLLWSKFWLNFLPLLLLGATLVFLSNILLRVPPWMMALSLATICAMTAGVAAIAVGVGALYPNFGFDNAAQIPTSFGGAVCMIFSIGFVAVTIMIEAWPMYRVAMRSLGGGIAQVSELTLIVQALLAVLVSTALAVIVPLRLGLKSLERLRD